MNVAGARGTRSWFCLHASTVLLLVSSTAAAQKAPHQDEVARSLFQAGKSAFDSGNYEDALQYFEQSFERSGRPQLQYNIGLAADRLRQDDKALTAFRAYLDQVPSAENREEVEGRIRALKKARAAREAAAPTPEEVALASQREPSADATTNPADAATAPSADKPITHKWWFWTGIGAVVVGAVITAVALSSSGETASQPFDSRSGVTVMTLRTP
jgi:tetratricopeptide (TPR) repeat protein